MDSKKLSFIEAAATSVIALALLSGCTSGSSAASAVPVVTSLSNSSLSTTTTSIGDATQRECTIDVRNSNESSLISSLQEIAQTAVSGMVTPVTVCIAAQSSPLNGFGASFRVEYEDNIGLHWVTFRSDDLIYSTWENNTFRIIYYDQYGYVQLNASMSNGNYYGTIQAADTTNNTVYADEINSFLQDIQNTCSGNIAACLNPLYYDPTYSSGSTTSSILQQANNAFAGQDNIISYTLGTVTFSASDISPTLF